MVAGSALWRPLGGRIAEISNQEDRIFLTMLMYKLKFIVIRLSRQGSGVGRKVELHTKRNIKN